MNKVFGLGLGHTGTKSLNEALCTLGIPSIHYPHDRQTYHELNNGIFRLSILEKYQAVTDITLLPFYPLLDAEYPGSQFILTTRNREDWLDGYERRTEWVDERGLRSKYRHYIRRRLRLKGGIRRCLFNIGFYKYLLGLPHLVHRVEHQRIAVYGLTQRRNRAHMGHVYDRHHEGVMQYFKDRPDDLLVMNVLEGDGWEVLCRFLNKPVPDQPFPAIKSRMNGSPVAA